MLRSYLKICWEHPKRLLALATVMTVLLAVFTYGKLDFNADRTALFKASAGEKARQAEFERRFGGWHDLVLVVDGGTSDEREGTVRELASFLGASSLVTDVRAKVELPGVEHLGLYFLSLEELRRIDDSLAKNQEILKRMSRDGWYGFLEYLQERDLSSDAAGKNREKFAEVWKQAVDGRGVAELDDLFPRMDLPQRSFYIDGRNRHLIFFRSEDPLRIKEEIAGKADQIPFSGRIVLTGQPLLQAEERQETIRDAVVSTIVAIVVVQLILILGFRETARPRLAFLSLVFGLLWSVAWAAATVGALNIITINFIAITVGLGVDFSIHILARYAEESEASDGSVEAMERTLRTTGVENLVGAIATSLAFWALTLTEFLAVQQLGLITGVAVPLCFLSVVTLLPPLLFWREQRLSQNSAAPFEFEMGPGLLKLEKRVRRRPGFWLLLATLAIFVMGIFGGRVRFDYNLLNMQSGTSEAVRYEKEGGFNSLAAFVVADSPAQARELQKRLRALPAVSEVQTVAELVPEHVVAKRPLVESIVRRVKELPRPAFDPSAKPDWERMERLANSLSGNGNPEPWVLHLKNSGPGPVEDVWRQMQSHLKSQLDHMLERLAHQDTHFDIEAWKKHSPDLKRLSNLDGKTLLRVRAKHSLWERPVLVEFLDQVEMVTDKGIGPPFLIRNYLEQLRKSYFDAVRYAILAIVVLLFLHFRALVPTLIALVPKVVGAVGMFFAMAVFSIDLNPANCMALPLTLGIGLVFGIHAVHRLLESEEVLLVQGGTGKAIALSAWTTIASFGTLMVASHPGIFSLGFVMATGVGANMLATYLLVPPLIELSRNQLSRKK